MLISKGPAETMLMKFCIFGLKVLGEVGIFVSYGCWDFDSVFGSCILVWEDDIWGDDCREVVGV